ncbi:MAG: pyruvate formate-lyase-activating protein [Oscillospiraceae bacterium]|nr:pyruvate formate-lyase-activating protein [Oscillospiraceae bacterium]
MAYIAYDREQTGYVHSVETGGMVDGPGIRYVVFFSGCTLRCRYCHNPDTWKLRDGKLLSVEDVVKDIKKYRSYLRFSGGGVTITGGEPFVQPAFLVALLKACKAEGFHTALDTSGYGSLATAKEAFQYTDLLLLDIKTINPAAYKKLTGVPLDKTLQMLQLGREMDVPVWVRFVLVPGLTDDPADLQALADYLRDFPNIERIEVMPFHKLGEHKWAELGIPYTLTDVEAPSRAELDQAREIVGDFRAVEMK